MLTTNCPCAFTNQKNNDGRTRGEWKTLASDERSKGQTHGRTNNWTNGTTDDVTGGRSEGRTNDRKHDRCGGRTIRMVGQWSNHSCVFNACWIGMRSDGCAVL